MATPPGSGGVPQTRGIDWSQAMPGATLAGVLVAGAWLLPSITVFLWVLAGGALATALYHRHRPDAVLTPGAGARIGVVSGLLGFVLFAVTMAATLLATGGDKLREMIQQVIEQATARNADPAAQEMLQRFNSPAGIAAMMTIVMVVFLVVFAGLSAVGGAIGASLVSKHRKGGNAQQ